VQASFHGREQRSARPAMFSERPEWPKSCSLLTLGKPE
jgi:hypothetical protein